MSQIGNLISIVKVASLAKKLSANVPNTRLNVGCLKLLYRWGYIRGFRIQNYKNIVVLIKFKGNIPAIKNINIISTPGRRVYFSSKKIKSYLSRKDRGYCIVSTNKGLVSDEEAVLLGLGGEMILKVF